MKTNRIQRIATAVVIALGFCSMGQAQQPGSGNLQTVQPVSAVTENFTIEKLVGKPLRGTNQEQLSTIEDFLIDPQSGRIHFTVVGSGSNTFRIIPQRALQPQGNQEAFMVQRAQAEWDQVGTMTANQLASTVTIDDDHQQRLMRQFGLPSAEPAAQSLVRASSLKGRELRGGNDQIGTVEDVVIDYNNQVAAPVVRVAAGGPEQRFVVPMARLQFSAGQGPIMTTLMRNEFLQTSQSQALAPTGADSRWYGQQGNRPIGSAIMAVQQALETTAALPRGTVQVVPESRLVLRGTVENEQKKAEAERAAQQAAPGMRIENQLTVRQ